MRGITDERAEKALRYLATTDEECAALKADAERAEFKAKAVKDTVFRHAEGSVADRQAYAGSSAEYLAAMEEYFDTLRKSDAMRNKRATEVIVLDAWRTIQANQRKGA